MFSFHSFMYSFISHYIQFVCVNVLIFSGALDCMCFVLQSFCVRVVLSEIIHFFSGTGESL